MLAKLARAYVYLVLIVLLASVTLSVTLQVYALTGFPEGVAPLSKKLLFAAFLSMAPAVCLAKERNVWKNEFTDCPWWMKAVVISSCIYAFLVMLSSVAMRSSQGSAPEEVIPISAFILAFSMMNLCVVGSVLWLRPLSDPKFIKRALISTIAAALAVGFFLIPNL